ncbi:hypothetical protein ADK47_28885 [Streptomyces rimosus subsp. rimosus]|nr:hypothetical protein ADK84_30175 [Streptomyces sp. NRRL WC-3701]KOT32275.1 hypothetical protein ADK42_26615 [Streptomyces rimosus subsp. rimosus]KOT54465.1 hypothetical protein ADK44_27300 [Streptomyces rimosus subsp. rimosus]KOT55958.1 hypothetical protein ADK45_28260 [Streptomyces rimosus subsp. rimosus]KOT72611.1 hypothetical protein ADK47_28885 [Streptomyces rimosus subsp. rimosus]
MRSRGFIQAERRALNGSQDRGDVAGIPGTVLEVKNCARTELASWVDEAEIERVNDGASLGAVWSKRRGKSNPADWFVIMSGRQFVSMLRELLELPPQADEPKEGEAA